MRCDLVSPPTTRLTPASTRGSSRTRAGSAPSPGPGSWASTRASARPAETNGRFRALLDAGVTGFSVALDLPTQMGLDSDDPAAAGEVGKVGVAIDSLADIEILMDGIPLERISQVRTTANSIGYIWAAMFVALAEQRGLDPNAFGMFIQNDVLKEYIARGTQIFPPGPSLRLSVDVLEYVAQHVPRWVPLAVSGYHIRESGADAAQEIAFTFANAMAYLDAAVARGVSIDAVAPTLFTFLSSDIELLPGGGEVPGRAPGLGEADPRRGTRARDPRSEQLRIFVFTAGSSLTAQQPLNNVVRTTVEAIAAALAGVQTMHVCAYDEAVGVPTEAAATLALRTQQIVAFETGLTETVDPLGGSYAVEALTDELERGDRGPAGRDRGSRAARWPASSRAGSRTSSPPRPIARRGRWSRGRSPSSASTGSQAPSDPLDRLPHATRPARSDSATSLRALRGRRSQATTSSGASTSSRQRHVPVRTSSRPASRPSRPTRRSARSSGACGRSSGSGGRRARSDRDQPL